MGFLTGLVRGVNTSMDETRRTNEDKAAKQHELEMRVYEHLVNADDPEIRNLAITGVLSGAAPQKKKGGLAGWLGEVQSNPILEQITRLNATPVTKTRQQPSANVQPMTAMPGAAVPPPSEPGFVGPRQEGAQPAAVPPPSGPAVDWRTESYQVPRQAFKSRSELAAEQTDTEAQRDTAKYASQVEGMYQGLLRAGHAPDQAREIVRAHFDGTPARVPNPKDDYRRPIYERAAKGDPDAIRQVEMWDNIQATPEDRERLLAAQGARDAAAGSRADAAADRHTAADDARRNAAERWKEGELLKLETKLEKEYPELEGIPPERLARHEQEKQRVQDSYLVQIGASKGPAAAPPPGAPRAPAPNRSGRGAAPGAGGDVRAKATAWLQQNAPGHPVTPANIDAVIAKGLVR